MAAPGLHLCATAALLLLLLLCLPLRVRADEHEHTVRRGPGLPWGRRGARAAAPALPRPRALLPPRGGGGGPESAGRSGERRAAA